MARFEQESHTNPEALLAAAVHLEQRAGGFSIPRIELTTRARIPGISAEKFAALA